MKKILTLLIATGAFVSIHAQSRQETRDVILGGGNNGHYPTTYPSYPNNGNYGNDRQYQIDQVNREYNAKIESIRNNRYLSYQEKDRMIRQLEKDRQKQLALMNRHYKNARYDDRYNRHDNGKHKGWDKKNKNRDWNDD